MAVYKKPEPSKEERVIYERMHRTYAEYDIAAVLEEEDIDIEAMDQVDFDIIVEKYMDAITWDWHEVASTCVNDRLGERV